MFLGGGEEEDSMELENRGESFLLQIRKKPSPKTWLSNLAPPTGLEPVTCGLTVRRSTN